MIKKISDRCNNLLQDGCCFCTCVCYQGIDFCDASNSQYTWNNVYQCHILSCGCLFWDTLQEYEFESYANEDFI